MVVDVVVVKIVIKREGGTDRQTDKEERYRLTIQTLARNGEDIKRPTRISVVATVLIVIKTYIETETGRETQRETERQADRQTDRQTEREPS